MKRFLIPSLVLLMFAATGCRQQPTATAPGNTNSAGESALNTNALMNDGTGLTNESEKVNTNVPPAPVNPAASWPTFTDTAFGYQLQYPTGWSVGESPEYPQAVWPGLVQIIDVSGQDGMVLIMPASFPGSGVPDGAKVESRRVIIGRRAGTDIVAMQTTVTEPSGHIFMSDIVPVERPGNWDVNGRIRLLAGESNSLGTLEVMLSTFAWLPGEPIGLE